MFYIGGPGRAAMPSPGSTANFRSRLWAALELLFDASVYSEYHQVICAPCKEHYGSI
jgi:hypothetical protein